MWSGLVTRAVVAGLASICFVATCMATAVYRYKKGEFVTIFDGLSPNREYAGAAHGDGEYGDEDFHLYLFSEPDHRKIGALEEVTQILDTAAHAYIARWSAAARHVGLLYRSDRHIGALTLYRIENRRAHIVTGLSLLAAKTGAGIEGSVGVELRARNIDMKWLDDRRFQLSESGTVWTTRSDLERKLGFLAETSEADSRGEAAGRLIEYRGKAICRLVSGDRYEIVEIQADN